MAKTLKDLLLAMLNATLILVALCLFLALTVVNQAHSPGQRPFAEHLHVLGPLRESVQETGEESCGVPVRPGRVARSVPGSVIGNDGRAFRNGPPRWTNKLADMQASLADLRQCTNAACRSCHRESWRMRRLTASSRIAGMRAAIDPARPGLRYPAACKPAHRLAIAALGQVVAFPAASRRASASLR